MHPWKISLIALVATPLVGIATPPRQATPGSQLLFNANSDGVNTHFEYKWRGHTATEKADFSLSNTTLLMDKETFQDVPACLSDIFQSLNHEKAWVERSYGVKVDFVQKENGWTNRVTGPGEQPTLAQEYLASRNTLIENGVFARRLYRRTPIGELSPDHVAISRRYASDMRNVSFALRESGEKPRTTVARCLSFIQAIPYSTELNAAGLLSPVSMLMENKGDCDTKCAALAAILKNYGISSVFVTINKHMLMGINIPSSPADMTITVGNTKYVLAEPTGPSNIPLGKVDTDLSGELEVSEPTIVTR